MACYDGPLPVKDEERLAIWKWAKANGIDQGLPIEKVSEAINQHFFGGDAKPEWITDILSGRKTPFKQLTADAWRKQYNRREIIFQAENLSKRQAMGPVGKLLSVLDEVPRSIAVAGHGLVFPFSHAGDLAFRPSSWNIFVKGVMHTYHGTFSKSHAAKMVDSIEGQKLFPLALQAGLDAGPRSHPIGILSKFLKSEMSERSWKMLTVMRYKLWESQVKKWLKPGMAPEEELEVAKTLAIWANHATGSGKGKIAEIGSKVLFGPALTQSKINRLTIDPYKTAETWAKILAGKPVSLAEKAVARTRLVGATQYLLTQAGFLLFDQAVLSWSGSKQNINYTDPSKGDYLQFKGLGLEGNIPGLHTEIRTLARIVAAAFASKHDLHGKSRRDVVGDIGAQYLMNKASPAVDIGLETLLRQNWRGQPLPWSDEKGTASNPKLDWPQYVVSHAPIPLEGPIGYVYNKLKQNGASSMDAMTITKGLIIFGLGGAGIHVREEPEPKPKKSKSLINP